MTNGTGGHLPDEERRGRRHHHPPARPVARHPGRGPRHLLPGHDRDRTSSSTSARCPPTSAGTCRCRRSSSPCRPTSARSTSTITSSRSRRSPRAGTSRWARVDVRRLGRGLTRSGCCPTTGSSSSSTGEDVLTAGLRQGIDLRYGCRHGKCTSCKYVVVEGDVVHRGRLALRLLRPGAGGGRGPAVLHLRPQPAGHHPVRRAARRRRVRPHPARGADGPRRLRWRRRRADLVECASAPTTPLPYRPGQYVEIGLPGDGERRSYSMTDPPDPSGRPRASWSTPAHRRVLERPRRPPPTAPS